MLIGEKIDEAIESRGWKVADVSRMTGIPTSRFAEWTSSTPDKPRRPTVQQLLLISRTLELPMEFFADDAMIEPPTAPVTPEERNLLWAIREMGLTPGQVLSAIAGNPFAPVHQKSKALRDTNPGRPKRSVRRVDGKDKGTEPPAPEVSPKPRGPSSPVIGRREDDVDLDQ